MAGDLEGLADTLARQHRASDGFILSILGIISSAMELRDAYTHRHQSKVTSLSEMLAMTMGLDDDFIFGLKAGALLHDVGKIALPSDLLIKPGKLNDAEAGLIRMHPEYGARVFDGVDLPWPVRDIILQHHERLDGSGYPHGLKNGEIILEARIVAVADTLDAMASDRPYRFAPGLDAALDVLAAGRGRHYDPDVVLVAEQLFGASDRGPVVRELFDHGDRIAPAHAYREASL